MTNYSIHRTIGSFYVDADGTLVSGPYDTEEKAKRRIRDLKRKDNNDALNTLPVEQTPPSDPIDEIPQHVDCPKRCLPVPLLRGQSAFRKYSSAGATNGGYGKFTDPGWINPSFNPYRGKSRNGYRPAHRANRFKSAR